MRTYVLLVERGAEPGRQLRVDGIGPQIIGRARDASIRLGEGDRSVSRYHATLEVTPLGLTIRDLGGVSGTAVNGTLVTSAIVQEGDGVQLGDTLLRVTVEELPTVTEMAGHAPTAVDGAAGATRARPRLALGATDSAQEFDPRALPPLPFGAASEVESNEDAPATIQDSPLATAGARATYFPPAMGAATATDAGAYAEPVERVSSVPLPTMHCERCGVEGPPAPDEDLVDAGWLCGNCIESIRSHAPLQPKQLGEFDILRYHAAGGMGVVYEAVALGSGIHAAVKVLQLSSRPSDTVIQRFVREQRIHQQLRHANIIRCYEVGSHRGKLFIASEFVPGGDAQSVAGPELPLAQALRLGADLFAAVAHGHERGIVHRDIKPQNLLLTRVGADGLRRGKLGDFGLAKSLRAEGSVQLTRQGEAGGSVFMMGPEQLLDFANVGPSADLYAAAATLFRILTGTTPLVLPAPMAESTFPQITAAITSAERRAIGSLRADVPADVCRVIDALVAHDPSVRSKITAREVAQHLDGWAVHVAARDGFVA